MPKLFIPCAGRGTRFAVSGSSIPKPLVTVDGRPAVVQIIEQYPADWEVVVALGHKGNFIRSAIEAYFCDSPRLRSITFIETKSHTLEGQGLSHTLKDAKSELAGGPFVFHASDAILRPNIWQPDLSSPCNEVVVSASLFAGRFRSVRRDSHNVLNWVICDVATAELNEDVYVGVAHIVKHEEFWTSLEEQIESSAEGGETLGIDPETCSFARLSLGDWVDTGSGLAEHELNSWNSRPVNILPKANEALWFSPTTVTKFHTDKSFIRGRVNRAEELHPYVPSIRHHTDSTFTYDFVNGQTLSQALENSTFDSRSFYAFLEEFWFGVMGPQSENEECDFIDFYELKTLRRVSDLLSMDPQLSASTIIDGVEVPELQIQLDSVPWSDLTVPLWGRVHGDLHPENIVVKDSGEFIFLDWRQDIAGSQGAFGDVYYDLAKFAHGLRVDHGIIHQGLYDVTVGAGPRVSLQLQQNPLKVRAYWDLRDYVLRRSLSWKRVQIIEALIYLNIAPLHEPRTYRFLLGYLGRKLLHQALVS